MQLGGNHRWVPLKKQLLNFPSSLFTENLLQKTQEMVIQRPQIRLLYIMLAFFRVF